MVNMARSVFYYPLSQLKDNNVMMIQGNELKQYMTTAKPAIDIEGFVCLYVTKAAISIIRLCRN